MPPNMRNTALRTISLVQPQHVRLLALSIKIMHKHRVIAPLVMQVRTPSLVLDRAAVTHDTDACRHPTIQATAISTSCATCSDTRKHHCCDTSSSTDVGSKFKLPSAEIPHEDAVMTEIIGIPASIRAKHTALIATARRCYQKTTKQVASVQLRKTTRSGTRHVFFNI